MASDVVTRLGTRFEARAVHIGERIDVKGIDPRLSPSLPVIIEVAPSGYAVLLRAGAVVLFGVDPIQQERFLSDLGQRVQGRFQRIELERATLRTGDADSIEPDAIIVKEVTLERLQIIAEVLGKSVVLARYETDINDVFSKIEPLAHQMSTSKRRLPWKQADLVRTIGQAMLVEQELVGRAETLEKPDLLWDRPDLDRFYARLEDEYEIKERQKALDVKLEVVTRAAQTMLDLSQAKRSLNVEYYILGLIVFEVALAIFQLLR
ncbi:MAG TPA: RMD1 family protein [Kofleriaceae bacterium]|nr:RMD1 family protein [Kofleriaceae bacterium]